MKKKVLCIAMIVITISLFATSCSGERMIAYGNPVKCK